MKMKRRAILRIDEQFLFEEKMSEKLPEDVEIVTFYKGPMDDINDTVTIVLGGDGLPPSCTILGGGQTIGTARFDKDGVFGVDFYA